MTRGSESVGPAVTPRSPFQEYVRQTFLKTTIGGRDPFYSLQSSFNKSNVVNLAPKLEKDFGWLICAMKRTVEIVGSKKRYGTLTLGEVVGDELSKIFHNCHLSRYFVIATDSEIRKFSSTNSFWAFDPSTAVYTITYGLADNSKLPNMSAFDEAIGGELTLALMRA